MVLESLALAGSSKELLVLVTRSSGDMSKQLEAAGLRTEQVAGASWRGGVEQDGLGQEFVYLTPRMS